MRLPGVLKVLDTYEMDSTLYIVAERVTPLIDVLRTVETTEAMLTLIVYSVSKALKFINVEGSSVLGQLNLDTVYVTQAGEVKVGGFEICTNLNSDPQQPLYRLSHALNGFNDYLPPEVRENGIDVLRGTLAYKLDSWRLGVFMYRLFNDAEHHFDMNQLAAGNGISRSLVGKNFQRLVSSSPTTRFTVEQYIQKASPIAFDSSTLINVYSHLDEFTLKSEDEKIRLFETLESVKSDLLPGFLEYRVIPELVTFFTQVPTQSALALRYILSYAEILPREPFDKLVKPIIIKAYAVPDRQVRMLLLGFLPKYAEKLDKSDISDRIFNSFATGFSDSNSLIREETIKGVFYIAPKLADRQLNNELLRFLAKTQSDEKPEIRTTTTICLGKIAEYLNKSSRPTVLATAFGKALKDPFIHSRLAGIMALSSCLEYFTPDVISNKILTVIAPSLLDKSSKVRDEAQKAFDLFFTKIKEEAAKLTVDTEEDDDAVEKVASNVQNFGTQLSGALSKLTTGLGGSLNTDANNSLTPEDSRAGTPKVVESFQRVSSFGQSAPMVLSKPTQPTTQPKPVIVQRPKVSYSSWGDDEDIEIDADDDDNWGVDISKESKSKPQSMTPKVTALATESELKTTAKRGMQLKPKSKLKLELDVDDNDNWGDRW
jgi:SCY1-like protein 1